MNGLGLTSGGTKSRNNLRSPVSHTNVEEVKLYRKKYEETK